MKDVTLWLRVNYSHDRRWQQLLARALTESSWSMSAIHLPTTCPQLTLYLERDQWIVLERAAVALQSACESANNVPCRFVLKIQMLLCWFNAPSPPPPPLVYHGWVHEINQTHWLGKRCTDLQNGTTSALPLNCWRVEYIVKASCQPFLEYEIWGHFYSQSDNHTLPSQIALWLHWFTVPGTHVVWFVNCCSLLASSVLER